MSLKYNPIPLEEEDYKEKINFELNKGDHLSAFLLIFAYIESYLTELLLLSGYRFKDFNKKEITGIERIHFSTLVLIHLIHGRINSILSNKLSNFNKFRNKLIHELVSIDINDKKTQEELKKQTLFGMEICKGLSTIYMKTLNERYADLKSDFLGGDDPFD